ncbi:MAG: hypothetical protein COB46_02135 [Rhodospirillaceae bacterium]|nr:MAG: hypothetical protein COB46_02135 [Rhodospirillaceae bacterium]
MLNMCRSDVFLYIYRSVLFVIMFWMVWHFSAFFNVMPGSTVVSAFYPAPGFSIAFIAIFGWRYIPIVFLAAFYGAAPDIIPFDMPIHIWVNDIRQGLVYGLAGLILGRLLKGEPALTNTRNVLLFLMVAIGASLISATVAITNYWYFDIIPPKIFLNVFFSFWAGDCTGILMATPLALLAFRNWEYGQLWKQIGGYLKRNATHVLIALIFPVVVSGIAFSYIALTSEAVNFSYLMLIPIVWIAATLGASLGALSALVGNLSAAGTYSLLQGNVYTPTEMQVLFAVAAGIGLIVGASRNDRLKAEALAKEKETAMAHLSRLASIGELGTSIAHEIATPLQVASTNSQLAIKRLKENSEDNYSDIIHYQAEVQSAIERATEIHKRIRGFARGSGEIKIQPIDLSEAVNGALHLLEGDITQSEVLIDFNPKPNLPKVDANLIGMQQVYVNLIKNSIVAIETNGAGDGKINITITAHDNSIQVSVEDNGTGLTNGEEKCVFDSFYTTQEEGLGLGLAICKTTLEGIGGHIKAESTPTGARFITIMPMSRQTS